MREFHLRRLQSDSVASTPVPIKLTKPVLVFNQPVSPSRCIIKHPNTYLSCWTKTPSCGLPAWNPGDHERHFMNNPSHHDDHSHRGQITIRALHQPQVATLLSDTMFDVSIHGDLGREHSQSCALSNKLSASKWRHWRLIRFWWVWMSLLQAFEDSDVLQHFGGWPLMFEDLW